MNHSLNMLHSLPPEVLDRWLNDTDLVMLNIAARGLGDRFGRSMTRVTVEEYTILSHTRYPRVREMIVDRVQTWSPFILPSTLVSLVVRVSLPLSYLSSLSVTLTAISISSIELDDPLERQSVDLSTILPPRLTNLSCNEINRLYCGLDKLPLTYLRGGRNVHELPSSLLTLIGESNRILDGRLMPESLTSLTCYDIVGDYPTSLTFLEVSCDVGLDRIQRCVLLEKLVLSRQRIRIAYDPIGRGRRPRQDVTDRVRQGSSIWNDESITGIIVRGTCDVSRYPNLTRLRLKYGDCVIPPTVTDLSITGEQIKTIPQLEITRSSLTSLRISASIRGVIRSSILPRSLTHLNCDVDNDLNMISIDEVDQLPPLRSLTCLTVINPYSHSLPSTLHTLEIVTTIDTRTLPTSLTRLHCQVASGDSLRRLQLRELHVTSMRGIVVEGCLTREFMLMLPYSLTRLTYDTATLRCLLSPEIPLAIATYLCSETSLAISNPDDAPPHLQVATTDPPLERRTTPPVKRPGPQDDRDSFLFSI